MISFYRIDSGRLTDGDKEHADILIYSQPDEGEKAGLLQSFDLDPLDLEAIYDPDEVPRVEWSPESTFIVWKRPDNVSRGPSIQFEVSSVGFLLMSNRLVIILPSGELPLSGREFKRIESVNDCALRILLHTVHHYQGHLKAIKTMSQELQAKIITSMGNHYLLQMFALGESLIYYQNALEANFTVLSKLHGAPDKTRLTSGQMNLLDDVMIENQQACKQAGIYSTVLSGLMDARGTIINNNMNSMLKNLTVINVVFLPLNLIASVGGMSEYSAMTHGIHWVISYTAFGVGLLLLGWLTWWWLVKVIDRPHIPDEHGRFSRGKRKRDIKGAESI